MRNERKANLSIMLSIIALFLIIAIVVIWCISTKDFSVVTEDTFISVCSGLISLALPIVIGYQIINSLDIKQSLKTGEEKNEKLLQDFSKSIDSIKYDFEEELNNTKEINRELRNSLEIEKKERELIYQDMKVALYHGDVIQNSALALQEQIRLIKFLIELGRTEKLNENIKRSFLIIQGIQQSDFSSIKAYDKKTIVLTNPTGLFDLDQYEIDIKKQIRNLPQINEKYTKNLILLENSLDCKIQFFKNIPDSDIDAVNVKINYYLNQISEDINIM